MRGHLESSQQGFSEIKARLNCPGTFNIQSLVLGGSLGLCIRSQFPEDSPEAGTGSTLGEGRSVKKPDPSVMF